MNIAIFALTTGGRELSLKIASMAAKAGFGADVYLSEQLLKGTASDPAESFADAAQPATDLHFKVLAYTRPLKEQIASVFNRYDGFLFIMATGIVVRVLAPLIKDKKTDPAVVVMDEKGSFAIPILSGHLGGANSLACFLAELIGATPVITTSTDVQGKTAPDTLARSLNLAIEPWENLVRINSLLANKGSVGWFIQPNLAGILEQERGMKPDFQPLEIQDNPGTSAASFKNFDGLVFLTNRLINVPGKPFLTLRPRNIIAGVGCRRGTPAEEIIKAIEESLEEAGISAKSLAKIASVDIKHDEQGILEAADYFRVPTEFFDRAAIGRAFEYWPGLHKSDYVKHQIGVEGVCEPAALLGGKATTLLKPRKAKQGITLALAEDVSWWLE